LKVPCSQARCFFRRASSIKFGRPRCTLPFPDNLEKQEGVNTFAQFDWIVSQKQFVTATVHVAPQRLQYANMDYFNPQLTAPDTATHNYTVTLGDHLALGGGLLQSTLSATQFDARIWGQGLQDLNITPGGNTGNYFAQQDRQASRLGLSSIFSLAPLTLLGTHNVKVGVHVAESSEQGQAIDQPRQHS
jgi:hypothetical protein